MRRLAAAGAGLVVLASSLTRPQAAAPTEDIPKSLAPGDDAWQSAGLAAIRGVTVGPIESALHPDRGYGSDACAASLREVKAMGANWVSLTPFGRVWDLEPTGVSPVFEAELADNRRAIKRAVEQAHAQGLKVLLVPHLWVETGGWRALIDPGGDDEWTRWAKSYRNFVLGWARVAADAGVEMFSVGVELRSWVTSERAPSFVQLVRDVRRVYPGLVTYAGNWDDVERTVVLGELDVIGINAFYPLAEKEGADFDTLVAGGRAVATRVRHLADSWQRPVMFTEFGYTTRPDPAVKPWEWPDHMQNVQVDQVAQARAYTALLAPLMDEPSFAGLFVWRVFADPHDTSQEAEWGFSPRGKLAELVLRDAFSAHWAVEGPRPAGFALGTPAARGVGLYPTL